MFLFPISFLPEPLVYTPIAQVVLVVCALHVSLKMSDKVLKTRLSSPLLSTDSEAAKVAATS